MPPIRPNLPSPAAAVSVKVKTPPYRRKNFTTNTYATGPDDHVHLQTVQASGGRMAKVRAPNAVFNGWCQLFRPRSHLLTATAPQRAQQDLAIGLALMALQTAGKDGVHHIAICAPAPAARQDFLEQVERAAKFYNAAQPDEIFVVRHADHLVLASRGKPTRWLVVHTNTQSFNSAAAMEPPPLQYVFIVLGPPGAELARQWLDHIVRPRAQRTATRILYLAPPATADPIVQWIKEQAPGRPWVTDLDREMEEAKILLDVKNGEMKRLDGVLSVRLTKTAPSLIKAHPPPNRPE